MKIARWCWLPILAVMVAVPIGCEQGSSRGEHAGIPTDSAGPGSAPEIVRIRSEEASGGFGRIDGLAVDSEGRAWILDGLNFEIVVYDTLGHRMMAVGSEGEGPGELLEPMGLFADRTGRIWVSDGGTGRYSAFDHAGQLVEEKRREVVGQPSQWRAAHLNGDTYVESGAGLWGRFWTETVFLLDDSLRKQDSISVGESLPTFDFPDGAPYNVPIPWRTEYVWTPDGDGGIWRGHTRPYLLANVTMSGDTIRTIRGADDAVPVTRSERDRVLAVLDSVHGVPISAQADVVPATKPAITALYTSWEGDLWVRRWWEDTVPGTRFDVFSPDGRQRGTVTLDVRIYPPIVIRDGRLFAVVRDEFGVESVTARRVQGLDP